MACQASKFIGGNAPYSAISPNFNRLGQHHQSPHGCHAFSNEDTAASCLRDGATRTRLQSHPCHEHHGHSATHGRDEGIVEPEKMLRQRYPANIAMLSR